jgi:hypothetical protein
MIKLAPPFELPNPNLLYSILNLLYSIIRWHRPLWRKEGGLSNALLRCALQLYGMGEIEFQLP